MNEEELGYYSHKLKFGYLMFIASYILASYECFTMGVCVF